MTNLEKLRKIYKANSGYITREDVNEAQVPSWFLSSFVRSEKLVRLAPGFYASSSWPIDDYFLFQKRYQQVVFSGLSALYLWELSDKIPEKIEATAPFGYHPFSRTNPLVEIHFLRNKDSYHLGIAKTKTIFGHEVFVYDKEKLICDLVAKRKSVDPETFVKAVYRYVRNEGKDFAKLLRYARLLGIENEVYDVIEVAEGEN